ncbi:MBL fold metallo-hydrolase [Dehalococcoidia bacterium]|nr:MBL fold metallo-hydrolase [Dehalococcoidia bacterium]
MKIHVIPVTSFVENVYIISDEDSKEGAIVDPGGEADRIIKTVEELGLTIKYILNTHGHVDHVGGVSRVQEATGAQFGIHHNDVEMSQRPPAGYVANLVPDFVQPPPPDLELKDGDEFMVGGFKLTIIDTPGHTMGSLCVAGEGVLFSGDTLFQGSVGRTDFPGSSTEALVESIRTRLFELAEDTVVLPGHGAQTSIGFEKENNPFVGTRNDLWTP